MISATSNWIAANSNLKLKPIYIAHISGYAGFSTAPVSDPLYPWLGLAGLVGAFTDGSGQLIKAIPLGRNTTVYKVPVGATQLQLGINDDIFFGSLPNFGSFNLKVNGIAVTVPGTTCPWTWADGGLNTAFKYGFGANFAGASGPGGSAPIVAVTGLIAGDFVSVQYLSGTVSYGFSQTYGNEGDLSNITADNGGNSSGGFPTKYMPDTVYPWLTGIDDLSLTVSDLDGGADLADFSFTVQDKLQAITAIFPDLILEGSTCQLLEGYGKFDPQNPRYPAYDSATVLHVREFLIRFTGRVDSIASQSNNQEYQFTAPDIRKDLSKVIYQTGDDGFPTDQNHRKTITGNPIDILINVLQSQVGYGPSSIDIAGLTAYRDSIFSGWSFSFSLDSPPAAKDFIENEILKPLGGYHWPSNLGIFKVNFSYPLNLATSSTWDHTKIIVVPQAGQSELVNQVTYRFDADTGGKFQAETVQSWSASITKFGLFGEHIVESVGMRSAFQGEFLAQFIAHLLFLKYGDKQLLIEGLQAVWSESRLEPGDFIAVTSNLTPDRDAGVMGIVGKTFEVLDRGWSPFSGVVTLKLLERDLSPFKQFLITPNGEADFTLDTAPNKAKYLYLSNAAGKYSDGSTANTLC